MNNPLLKLEQFNQSVWLDFISRDLIEKDLRNLIKNDHLKGITSNPVIWEKTIKSSLYYDQFIDSLIKKNHIDSLFVYEQLAIKDIKDAADIFYPVYEKSSFIDGMVSFELSPHLAFDAENTIKEGKRLWGVINRPNVMIKVPGTKEGMIAICELIKEGINVNVTLLFSVNSYQMASKAYLDGLKARLNNNLAIDKVISVASFFISRIDTKVDELLKGIIAKKPMAKDLMGKLAIANAKLAYLAYEKTYNDLFFKDLKSKGARPQRLLWASTSTKNDNYSDVLYVEELIAKETINTIPLSTLNAFRDHGKANKTFDKIKEAQKVMDTLDDLGIDFNHACDELLEEGLKIFADAYDLLISSINEKIKSLKEAK